MIQLLLLVSCAGPDGDSGPSPDTGTSDDTAGDTDRDTVTDTTESTPVDSADSASGTDTAPEDSGGDSGGGTTTWGGACTGLAPEPIATWTFTSTWTNGACPSFAPYDEVGRTWSYGSLAGNLVAFSAETYGGCELDGQDVWLVHFSGTGYDYGAAYWLLLVCDEEGVSIAAEIDSGTGSHHSWERTAYYDPPLLLLPATLTDGETLADTAHVLSASDYDTPKPPEVTESDLTVSTTVEGPSTLTTYGAGDLEAWSLESSARTVGPLGTSLFVSDGVGIVEFGDLSLGEWAVP